MSRNIGTGPFNNWCKYGSYTTGQNGIYYVNYIGCERDRGFRGRVMLLPVIPLWSEVQGAFRLHFVAKKYDSSPGTRTDSTNNHTLNQLFDRASQLQQQPKRCRVLLRPLPPLRLLQSTFISFPLYVQSKVEAATVVAEGV